jgi:3-oxoadipate enol-lactonase
MTAVASEVLGRWFSAAFREREPATVSRAECMLLSINPTDYVLACAAARDADQRANVTAVRASTLVISGTHDQATPRSEGLWLAEHVADARYVELPAAHLSNIEASAGFNEVLLSFLTESRDPNG